MKETKLYWYHNTAYSMKPYIVYLHFPNLIRGDVSDHLDLSPICYSYFKLYMIPPNFWH